MNVDCLYRLHAAAKCPKGGRDEYEVIIAATAMIEVEAIIESVERHTAQPIFQEALCEAIAEDLDKLPDPDGVRGGRVTVKGTHSGVYAECQADFGVGL